MGLKGHPCLTPELIGIGSVKPVEHLPLVVAPVYRSLTTFVISSGIPSRFKVPSMCACGSDPKTFARSSHAMLTVFLERPASSMTYSNRDW